MVRGGSYVTLASKADDGSSQVQWVVTNGWLVDGIGGFFGWMGSVKSFALKRPDPYCEGLGPAE